MSSPIEYLKGVGPQRADLLKKEAGIFTFGDLLDYFPFRHVDKTKVNLISEITPETEYIQVAATVTHIEKIGAHRGKRLVAEVKDKSGTLELVWFEGLNWVEKNLQVGQSYLIFGKPGFFMNRPQLVHPETELLTQDTLQGKSFLEPIYSSTEKLKAKGLGGKQIGKLTKQLLDMILEEDVAENLPADLRRQLRLPGRYLAYRSIHFPAGQQAVDQAIRRIKFEELFIAQIRTQLLKSNRHHHSRGIVFDKVGDLFNTFYQHHLPFALTGAQKRVIKEIRTDMGKGRQMNRLLQGDVGSGKTAVALLCMLLAADNDCQSCLMAPTEILAQQHYAGIRELLADLPVETALLTGSTKTAERKRILQGLLDGTIRILIGTHAIIEEVVQFKRLGFAVIDEQHRFGVAQRAALWKKGEMPPHILVMTATPIPRTLAMTVYGELDYSIMNELPPGRQPITTVHRFESARAQVMDFIKEEIAKGRQAYIIFPLIEESSKLDYENLMRGYENVKAFFPEPKYWISMVHGKQPAVQKETNMHRFVSGDTQIMVSTTVIEVGVNVPNASVMVIESAEKFGLSQLHQLRGRVGRGAHKSYCILVTGNKLGADARERMKIMTSTTDGFVIAEKDLELRGPGEIEGTRQSGALNFKLASIVQDRAVLETARSLAEKILGEDPGLDSAENLCLRNYLGSLKGQMAWSRIS